MIDDYVDKIILEAIPPKKYNADWNAKILKKKRKKFLI